MQIVNIIESELDWGQKIEEVKEFDDLISANTFIEDFNSENDLDIVPGWYMYAELA